ncbi:MAG: NifB/NifX family molybdenum-iron cluster-binding protein [Bacteroidota bacterium]|nr:NifB/NifX family molybdenum-iron cluster-binding protein [Bacteroidota bacterium]
MKIAITSKGNEITSEMDPRFGRSGYIAIYDTETGTTEFIEGEGKNQQSGAGPKAAEMIANTGAKKIFSGHFGPKAKSALESFGIEMISLKDEGKTIEELISKFK